MWYSDNFFPFESLKDKTILETATESEKNPEIEKMNIKMQTLLLAYLTAKVSWPSVADMLRTEFNLKWN